MDPIAILQVVQAILALYPTVEPAVVKAVQDFEALFANGATPTQAEIDVLIGTIKTQSASIQAIAE